MKKRILAIVLLVLLTDFIGNFKAIAQSSNCERFKTGTFKMVYNGMTDIIKRNGNLQTETLNNYHVVHIYYIKWIDKCTYTLTPTSETLTAVPAMPKNMVLTVRIIKSTKDSYIQIASSNISTKTITAEIVKI